MWNYEEEVRVFVRDRHFVDIEIAEIITEILIGFAAAIVATLPAFLSAGSDASLSTVALVTGLILLNGFLWIFGLTWFSLQKKMVVSGLRVE